MDRQEVPCWTGTTLEGTPSINTSLPAANIPFQTISDGTSIDQALGVDTSSTISPRGSTGAPTEVPQGDQPVRRKVGRPRKHGPDGALLTQSASSPAMTLTPARKRGRQTPPGTRGKQQLASFGGLSSGTAGAGFTPHVITIARGEDVGKRIISLSLQERRSICVLSAYGGISTVTLLKPSTSGGIVKHEGIFEILCLSGSFVLDDSGGSQGLAGGLSVSLAGPDGHFIGGAVGGILIAASPVQVIIGSFLYSNSKANRKAMESIQSAETSDQNLTSTSSMGNCPSSMQTDLQTRDYETDKRGSK